MTGNFALLIAWYLLFIVCCYGRVHMDTSSSELQESDSSSGSFLSALWHLLGSGLAMLLGGASRSNANSGRVLYRGFQLLRVHAKTDSQFEDLRDLRDQYDNLQFWAHAPKNHSTDILVPPENAEAVKEFLGDRDIDYRILSTDIQKSISFHNPRITKEQRNDLLLERGHAFTWRRYHRFADMVGYLEYLSFTYPHLVDVLTIGMSSEGLPIKVLKISTDESLPDPLNLDENNPPRSPRPAHHHQSTQLSNKKTTHAFSSLRLRKKGQARHSNTTGSSRVPRARRLPLPPRTPVHRVFPKPAIWIDGGSHAREWVSPAVALFIIQQLVERFERNRRLVLAADWYILPMLNPDGYEFSHTTDRLWRKTRSSHETARMFFGQPCAGVDLNRNWNFHWGERGASDNPCHETYAGPRPFSEPESRATADFILKHKERIQLYLSLHSYSQLWLVPWGHTDKRPADHEDLVNKANIAVQALRRVYGTHYEVGASPSLLYPTSGSSDDWAKGAAGIKYAYSVELRDKGAFGFLLPASLIIPTAKETFAAIKALANAVVCRN